MPRKITESAWWTRRTALFLWVAAWFWLIAATLCPYGAVGLRAITVLALGVLLLGALALWWPVRKLRWTLLGLIALVGLFLVLPGRAGYNRFDLREAVVSEALQYEGVRVRAGGENRFGIDGPGLVRRTLVDALGGTGLRTVNPGLVRQAAAVWWSGIAPAELAGSGGNRAIRRVCETPGLEALKDRNLHQGDFAVSRAEGHPVLVYLGDHRWVDASGPKLRVLRLGRDKSAGFQTPVTVLRWRCLELPRR